MNELHKYYQLSTVKSLSGNFSEQNNSHDFEWMVEKIFNSNEGKKLDVAECGCGLYSLLPHLLMHPQASRLNQLVGFDFVEEAIAFLSDKFKGDKRLHFKLQDMTLPFDHGPFDVVIDSHLLHCLTDLKDRKNYLENIMASLKSGGIFLIETGVATPGVKFHDFGQGLLHDQVYWQLTHDFKMIPARAVYPSYQIEKELVEAGFVINYLKVDSGKKLILSNERTSPLPQDADVCCIVCKRP